IPLEVNERDTLILAERSAGRWRWNDNRDRGPGVHLCLALLHRGRIISHPHYRPRARYHSGSPLEYRLARTQVPALLNQEFALFDKLPRSVEVAVDDVEHESVVQPVGDFTIDPREDGTKVA